MDWLCSYRLWGLPKPFLWMFPMYRSLIRGIFPIFSPRTHNFFFPLVIVCDTRGSVKCCKPPRSLVFSSPRPLEYVRSHQLSESGKSETSPSGSMPSCPKLEGIHTTLLPIQSRDHQAVLVCVLYC